MQVSQDGVAKFISAIRGMSNTGKPYFRLTVCDEENQVMTLYTTEQVINKVQSQDLQFGHPVQLVFRLAQWSSGMNVTCCDCIISKN